MSVDIWGGTKALRAAEALERIAIAHSSSYDITSYLQIQKLVQEGKAQEYFGIGDQIITTWSPDENTTYEMPWDIVSFGSVVDGDGETHANAMWLESHYAITGIQFSGNNAFYVPTSAMPAGKYYFKIGTNWGQCIKDKIYEFTTTQEIAANGQLVLGVANGNTSAVYDNAPSLWRVRTYANGFQETPTEVLSLTEVSSSSGTNLGTLSSDTLYANSGINNLQRSGYGYNRWSVSAMRQWLNSGAPKNEWWAQRYPHDHRPDQLASARGFEAGLPRDFLSIIKPVKQTTALNTVSDTQLGSSEDTVERFFLASLQQEYIAPQVADIEGATWQYWIDRLGSQHAQGGTMTEHIRYAIENHNSAQNVRLRSAGRGGACNAWSVNSSGGAYGTTHGGGATYAYRSAPACVIY